MKRQSQKRQSQKRQSQKRAWHATRRKLRSQDPAMVTFNATCMAKPLMYCMHLLKMRERFPRP